MVRNVAVAGMLLVLWCGGAVAAVQEAAPAAEIFSGPYLGIFAAHAWQEMAYAEPSWPGFERKPDLNGVLGGATVGYNCVQGRNLFGIEADAGFGNLDKGEDNGLRNSYSAFEMHWDAHLRGRIGYAVSVTTVLFATAGMAMTEVKVDDVMPRWDDDDALHIGWTAGVGVEYAITEDVRARAEYLYDDYGAAHYQIGGNLPYEAEVDLNAHVVRVGLSWQF